MTSLAAQSSRLLIAGAALFCAAAAPADAEETFASVLFQNDAFLGRDGGGYTSGAFISRMRVAAPGESGVSPALLLEPIVSGLGMPPATLASSTLGQYMVTPRDLTRRDPDPNDAPYMGALIFRSAQVYVHDDDIADMVAVNVGVIGPAAGAKQTQRFAHRITGSRHALGWDRQGPNKALVGVERYRAWRFAWGAAGAGAANGDVVTLAGGALGNVESSLGGTVLLRYGAGLDRSFPTVARVAAQFADPFVIGGGWFAYSGLSADRVFDDTPQRDGARFRKARWVAVAGMAYGWTHSSLTFSLQNASLLVESISRQSYGSITYSWRME